MSGNAPLSFGLLPGPLSGETVAPPSKSVAQRLLICAALSREPSTLLLGQLADDVSATARCLSALGAGVSAANGRIDVEPIAAPASEPCVLDCGESGATLRFLLPLAGALGRSAVFGLSGRLPQRPLYPLDALLCGHGMSIERRGGSILCSGRLRAGEYSIAGDVSSQFVSGLLMALSALDGPSRVRVTGGVESAGYIELTARTLALSGAAPVRDSEGFTVPGGGLRLAGEHRVEGDYSGAAFFLCAGALAGDGVRVRGLSRESVQGDRAILELLRGFGARVSEDADAVSVKRGGLRGMEIDASQIPDLVPALSVVAACAEGSTTIHGAARLRYKESDRLASVAAMLGALGAEVRERPDGLLIRGGGLHGGSVRTQGDHRIAMAAALAACAADGPVLIDDGDCVRKSWPDFWRAREELGGGLR